MVNKSGAVFRQKKNLLLRRMRRRQWAAAIWGLFYGRGV